MNANTIFLAIGIAAALAVVLAPSLVISDASAEKTKTCENRGGHEKDCESPAGKVEKCTAGAKGENSPNCSGAKE
jgi:hypothetical protein